MLSMAFQHVWCICFWSQKHVDCLIVACMQFACIDLSPTRMGAVRCRASAPSWRYTTRTSQTCSAPQRRTCTSGRTQPVEPMLRTSARRRSPQVGEFTATIQAIEVCMMQSHGALLKQLLLWLILLHVQYSHIKSKAYRDAPLALSASCMRSVGSHSACDI